MRITTRSGPAVFLAAAAVISTGLTAPASAAEDGPAPVLVYTMDDVADGNVPDSSGNGWDGVIVGDVPAVEGAEGGAIDVRSGSVRVPRPALEGATDLTVSARIRWDGSGGAWQWVFGLGSDTTRYLFATPSNGEGRIRAAVTTSGAGGEAKVTGYGALPADRWSTLTLTLDTEADILTAYVDGVALSRASTTATASQLLSAGAADAGAIGGSFYPDPAFRGEVDDFRVYHDALSAEEVGALVGGELPGLDALSQTAFEVRTAVGVAPDLPASIRASFTDGVDRDVPVEWEPVDPAQYEQTGTFSVDGTAAGQPVTTEVTVHRGEVRIDLGSNTGPVHGGASGVLYGLYGDGMPTDNLLEGMNVRSVATKAQDGSQHPGSDALEILPALSETTGGDVYLRVTDWYRGFPYQWPGDTPEEKLADYRDVLRKQLDMIAEIPDEQRAHLVIEPFNEPEGNMFGTGQWSLDGTSWLDDPTAYFAAWDETYRTIKAAFPDIRVAGPGTSVLFDQMKGFLAHTVEQDTVPDIITWHELSHPQAIRDSVERFRAWEAAAFEGTAREGAELPININEYAFNYHTSVPGQMIQWISAIEDAKVDAMIAFWNINGNLADSAVQSNRGNGQWWLYNSYAQLSGHTVELTPPSPGENYSLQGVAALDEERRVARALIGGASGAAPVDFANIPADVFGDRVEVTVREIEWTGQLGDSKGPAVIGDQVLEVVDRVATLQFGGDELPALEESSAYELVVTPADEATEASAPTAPWSAVYEAEDADYAGSGYSLNGPEGSPSDVSKFYTSGGYNVGGLRTGSDGRLSFTVEVPEDGSYDLSVYANSLNTYSLVAENGPTNVFLTVDGAAEQEILLPLGYKWVVWDHADTTVELAAGTHTITLAAKSLDGSRATQGDALVDRIVLTRQDSGVDEYEATLSDHDGTATYTGNGTVALAADQTATFWVHGARDGEALLEVIGSGDGRVAVNGEEVLDLARSTAGAVHLAGGINKVTVTGEATIDGLRVSSGAGMLTATEYQAEDATRSGVAEIVDLANAEGGKAVSGVGGEPGNDNTLSFTVQAEEAGRHAVVVRFSNPEQIPATHYNPNPMARHADISVNGGDPLRVLFVPTFHRNSFWERTIVLDLEAGENTITFAAEEQPNFDGVTYAEDNWPGIPLRAQDAPILDRITVSPLAAEIVEEEPSVTAPERARAGETIQVALDGVREGADAVIGIGRGDGSRAEEIASVSGAGAHEVALPGDLKPGKWTIVLSLDGEVVASTRIHITR
ncbi:LamG-like jellyroll fold domain-containing protein [Microbacterium sp. JZ101]